VTKAIYQFLSEHEGTLDVMAGRFEGKLCSASDVLALSRLPSKDEMRAQLLATLEAPLSGTLQILDQLLTSVLYCVDNKTQSNN
jgi:large subunit ribosomal protein L10